MLIGPISVQSKLIADYINGIQAHCAPHQGLEYLKDNVQDSRERCILYIPGV